MILSVSRWTALAALGACLAVTSCSRSPRATVQEQASAHAEASLISKPAPDFALTDSSGANVKLSERKGKVVLLNFWATWCGPCKVEIPWFIEFQNKYGKQGLQVVGVSIDDTLDKLKPYVANMKMNYVVLQGLDHDDIQDAYGPMFGVPVTILISRDGKSCFKHVGLSDKAGFESQIKALL